MGFLCGLALVSWIGFGGPKPPPVKLPVSTDNCTESISIDGRSQTMPEPDQYFYLYRISYAWTSAIGFIVTVLVGVIISEIVRLVMKDVQEVSSSLLTPCLQQKPSHSNHQQMERPQFKLSDTDDI